MDNSTLTHTLLFIGTLAAVVGAIITFKKFLTDSEDRQIARWDSVQQKIEAIRRESNEGRKEMYGRIETAMKEMRDEYVTKELVNAHFRRIDEGFEERDQSYSQLNQRLEAVEGSRRASTRGGVK